MSDTPLDLLSMLHCLGYSITTSKNGVHYASKTINGHFVGHFADSVNELYRLCTSSMYNLNMFSNCHSFNKFNHKNINSHEN